MIHEYASNKITITSEGSVELKVKDTNIRLRCINFVVCVAFVALLRLENPIVEEILQRYE
jgi:hypothetical protein